MTDRSMSHQPVTPGHVGAKANSNQASATHPSPQPALSQDQFRAAVLGDPIEHSLSPLLHNAGYEALSLNNWHYERFQCREGELAGLVSSLPDNYRGFSVTMPGKFEALAFASECTHRARLIGSANTLVRRPLGTPGTTADASDSGAGADCAPLAASAGEANSWLADNTDGDGLLGALASVGVTPQAQSQPQSGSAGPSLEQDSEQHPEQDAEQTRGTAVVVGNGGTARPALWALAECGYRKVTIVARSERAERLRPLADELGVEFSWVHFEDSGSVCESAEVLVSTVPAAAAEPYVDLLSGARRVVDVIYNPWPTPLLLRCAQVGVPCVGGLTMLVHQALSQFTQFTGVEAPLDAMAAAVERQTGISLGRFA